jgi:hypothetical protein
MASLQFCVIYDDRREEFFLKELNPDDWTTKVGLIVFFFYLLCTFPVYIDPVRLGSLAFIRQLEVFPTFIWAATGMIWLIMAMLMRAVVMRWFPVVRLISTAASGFMQLGWPAMMMIKLMGTAPKIHWVGIGVFIALSLAFVAYAISQVPSVLGF